MDTTGWFDDLPVIGKLPPEQAIIKLREVGEDDVADMLEMAQEAETKAFRSTGFRSWLHYKTGPGNIRLIHLATWLLLLLAMLHCLFNLLAPLPLILVLSILALKLRSAACVWHPTPAVVCTAFCCISSHRINYHTVKRICISIQHTGCARVNMRVFTAIPSLLA